MPTTTNNSPFEDIRTDPFVLGLLKKIPKEERCSFTSEQLQALKIALSGRRWGRHSLDIRGSFGFWTWRYYYVVIGGRERRLLSPREEHIHRMTNAFFLILFLSFSTVVGLLLLYLVKSALGIDLFPGSHLEIIPGYDGSTWKWFQEKLLSGIQCFFNT